jgi:hypothetical protein
MELNVEYVSSVGASEGTLDVPYKVALDAPSEEVEVMDETLSEMLFIVALSRIKFQNSWPWSFFLSLVLVKIVLF